MRWEKKREKISAIKRSSLKRKQVEERKGRKTVQGTSGPKLIDHEKRFLISRPLSAMRVGIRDKKCFV